MKNCKYLIVLIIFFVQFNSYADSNSMLIDKISKNLRCLICQGQSVYDSDSEFANSLKSLQTKLQDGLQTILQNMLQKLLIHIISIKFF